MLLEALLGISAFSIGALLAYITKLRQQVAAETADTAYYLDRYRATFEELSKVRGNNARWSRVELENVHHNADKVVNRLQFNGVTYDFTDEAAATALTRGQRNVGQPL